MAINARRIDWQERARLPLNQEGTEELIISRNPENGKYSIALLRRRFVDGECISQVIESGSTMVVSMITLERIGEVCQDIASQDVDIPAPKVRRRS